MVPRARRLGARDAFPVRAADTSRAVAAIEAQAFEDNDWARALVIDFARRYLVELDAELRGQDVSWAWNRYYELAANSRVSAVRVATTAIVVHLGVDLPYCLVDIGTPEERKDDY